MKKDIVSLFLGSVLFFTGCGLQSVNANVVSSDVKPADNAAGTGVVNINEAVDVKAASVETIKDYPTEKWYEGVSFGGGLGMLGGVNLQLGYRFPGDQSFLKNRLGFRVEYNTLSPIWNYAKTNYLDSKLAVLNNRFNLGDFDLDKVEPKVSSNNFGFNLDFYPFGKLWGLGNIRLSTGYYFGSLELGVDGFQKLDIASGSVNIGNVEIEPVLGQEASITLQVALKNRITGPYLGAGWDFWLPFGFKLFVDAGVVVASVPEVVADVRGSGKANVKRGGHLVGLLDLTTLPEFKEKEKEVKDRFNEEIKKVTSKYKDYARFFPMLKVGIVYRF